MIDEKQKSKGLFILIQPILMAHFYGTQFLKVQSNVLAVQPFSIQCFVVLLL